MANTIIIFLNIAIRINNMVCEVIFFKQNKLDSFNNNIIRVCDKLNNLNLYDSCNGTLESPGQCYDIRNIDTDIYNKTLTIFEMYIYVT